MKTDRATNVEELGLETMQTLPATEDVVHEPSMLESLPTAVHAADEWQKKHGGQW